jgi:hypothetical protein
MSDSYWLEFLQTLPIELPLFGQIVRLKERDGHQVGVKVSPDPNSPLRFSHMNRLRRRSRHMRGFVDRDLGGPALVLVSTLTAMMPLAHAAKTAGWSFWPSFPLLLLLAFSGIVCYLYLSQRLLGIVAKRVTTDKPRDVGDFVRLLAFICWLGTPIVAFVLGMVASTWIR